jgi:hypothetical protein
MFGRGLFGVKNVLWKVPTIPYNLNSLTNQIRSLSVSVPTEKHLVWKKTKYGTNINKPGDLLHRQRT